MSKSNGKRRLSYARVDRKRLSQAWYDKVANSDDQAAVGNEMNSSSTQRNTFDIRSAIERTLPLLDDPTSVPFVCRYRMDVIEPLTTKQVHILCDLTMRHDALASVRNKVLDTVPSERHDLVERIMVSTSKSELDDLYAPYKPPARGSIAERIQKAHPDLCQLVERWWSGDETLNIKHLIPRQAVVHLIAVKIAAEAKVMDAVMEEVSKKCQLSVKVDDDADKKYKVYHSFLQKLLSIRDHQVLAIRRGCDQKALKLSFDIDGERMENIIRHVLLRDILVSSKIWKSSKRRGLLSEAIHESWQRYLRRRATSRLWSMKCSDAKERAIGVFQENLRNALLAPPLSLKHTSSRILALDPGFKAGIKCASLTANGDVDQLCTIHILGNDKDKGKEKLRDLLLSFQEKPVVVALGNGHGSHEARNLLEEVSSTSGVNVEVHLVNEAGASVWSVTEDAKQEFPDDSAAAVAAVSIGRRLQNPLHELVKIPPRSLGLGMYQHDLAEKVLDDKLHLVSVDAVAMVGVDVNSCSLAILNKVPGITASLAKRIIQARPLRSRKDLLKIAGLGPKTFENCSAFVRVNGTEQLDSTLVHPESYDIARWLLKTLKWKIATPSSIGESLPSKNEWKNCFSSTLSKASTLFDVTQDRVLSIMSNLHDTIKDVDPRLGLNNGEQRVPGDKNERLGSPESCVPLLSEYRRSVEVLAKACPVRGVVGTLRNITDFGAFVDFGGEHDGLLHRSKLGRDVDLNSLMIGQEIGVDILQVEGRRTALSIHGLNMKPSDHRATGSTTTTTTSTTTSKRRYSSSTKDHRISKKRRRKQSR